MKQIARWFWVGERAAVRDALADTFGSAPANGSPDSVERGDAVVVDVRAAGPVLATLPHGHVFGAVRAFKARDQVRVFVVVDADDAIGVQLARFCLADGVLRWSANDATLDTAELRHGMGGPRRPSIDELLQRLQQEASASGQESSLQRLLRFEREDSLARRLQDEETGLYDGPFATLKLDEEWKRAHRFHQPLSLLLIDLGVPAHVSGGDRRALLADAAGLFLNECRDIDVLARFAADVFLFLLPGTAPEGALVLAQRLDDGLRRRVGGGAALAPSIGVASVPSSDIADRRTFLAVAESCLRRAQAGGAGGVVASWQ